MKMDHCAKCGTKCYPEELICITCGASLADKLDGESEVPFDTGLANAQRSSNTLHHFQAGWRTLTTNRILFLLPVLFALLYALANWYVSTIFAARFGFRDRFPTNDASFLIGNWPHFVHNPLELLTTILSISDPIFTAVKMLPTLLIPTVIPTLGIMLPMAICALPILALFVAMNSIQWRRTEAIIASKDVHSHPGYGKVGFTVLIISIVPHLLLTQFMLHGVPTNLMSLLMSFNLAASLINLLLFTVAMTALVASRFGIQLGILLRKAICNVEALYLLIAFTLLRFAAQLVSYYLILFIFTHTTRHNSFTHFLLQFCLETSIGICGAFTVSVWFHYLHHVAWEIEEFEPVSGDSIRAE